MAQDATGQGIITWTDYATLHCDVRDSSGAEVVRRGQIDATISGEIRTKYPRLGRVPQPEDRATWTEAARNGESRTVELLSVRRLDGRQRELSMLFREDA